MGSDAEICLFDHGRYVEYVVPALKGWLLGRELAKPDATAIAEVQLLDASEQAELRGRFAAAPVDLDAHCEHLDVTSFAVLAPPAIEARRPRWADRACRSKSCTLRGACHWHVRGAWGDAERVNLMLEVLISRHCLGERQFVGRSSVPSDLVELLDGTSSAAATAARALLDRLGRRGFTVGYTFANGDGTRGWLDPSESGILHDALCELPLPRVPPTFEGMRAFHRPGLGYRPPDGWSFPELSLAFVKTVAGLASRQGLGVVWGNDVL
ncbi:MAG: hypothetical protein AAF602_05880 [Myxococcota bacterium]